MRGSTSVSVPIRGLFNLTLEADMQALLQRNKVSVPIRGLFNLTNMTYNVGQTTREELVSVPIRGLFNLTWFWRWCLGVLKRRVSVPIRGLFNLTALLQGLLGVALLYGFRPH